MKILKIVAVVATVTLTLGAPSIAPTTGVGGMQQYQIVPRAYATPLPAPQWARPHGISPWPAVAVIIGTSSVILNAIYIWHAQCRELSSQEAATSAFLPLIGIAFDAQANKCHP
jgi:hypothetical protein